MFTTKNTIKHQLMSNFKKRYGHFPEYYKLLRLASEDGNDKVHGILLRAYDGKPLTSKQAWSVAYFAELKGFIVNKKVKEPIYKPQKQIEMKKNKKTTRLALEEKQAIINNLLKKLKKTQYVQLSIKTYFRDKGTNSEILAELIRMNILLKKSVYGASLYKKTINTISLLTAAKAYYNIRDARNHYSYVNKFFISFNKIIKDIKNNPFQKAYILYAKHNISRETFKRLEKYEYITKTYNGYKANVDSISFDECLLFFYNINPLEYFKQHPEELKLDLINEPIKEEPKIETKPIKEKPKTTYKVIPKSKVNVPKPKPNEYGLIRTAYFGIGKGLKKVIKVLW